MQEHKKPSFLNIVRYQLRCPSVMNWSYPLMLSAIMTALMFSIRMLTKRFGSPIPATSLIGYAVFETLLILLAAILPASLLSRGLTDRTIGNFTGAGSLILATISGIPIMLITTALYNFSAWALLRIGGKMCFPLFFYHVTKPNKLISALEIMTDSVIPAAGASLFFFGLLWSRFRSKERFVGYIIIAAAYALFSFDLVSLAGLFITGWWCSFLRTKTGNIAGPFLCLISSRLSIFLFSGTLNKVDILAIQTYSDIDSVYFYSSMPAIFMGVILLSFFMRSLDSFYGTYTDEEDEKILDASIPAFDKGINLTIIVSGALFLTMWILVCKGVHL